MTDNRLVLITGAGASSNLGRDGKRLPLMAEWCLLLRSAFDQNEPGLADALGLHEGLSGEEFEEALGAYLSWEAALPLTKRFSRLGSEPGHGLPERSDILDWLRLANDRFPRVRRLLNDRLWDDFGIARVDPEAAVTAYRSLCVALLADPVAPNTEIFSVTTNYDRSGELAWRLVGYSCDTGMRSDGLTTPFLRPDDIAVWGDPKTVGHVHLHGAVGWYRDTGRIRIDPADQPYDFRLIPAVLYPDPDKNPFAEGGWGADALWRKFVEALESATHVLVLGHSLHDRPVLDALSHAAKRPRPPRFGFCYHPPHGADDLKQRLTGTAFGSPEVNVSLIPLDFGPHDSFPVAQRWMLGEIIQPS